VKYAIGEDVALAKHWDDAEVRGARMMSDGR
jgi:hypothetical protein